jgi:predicted HTH domain antitoxin
MDMQPITIQVPEELITEDTDPAAFARELSLLAAVKLYEHGRVSSGRAAELAGLSRIEFLAALQKFQVFPLESELEDLESQHA